MRRCCEETLRVLRRHKEFLLTIVEVFLHDPLYRWGLTPRRARKAQKEASGDRCTPFDLCLESGNAA